MIKVFCRVYLQLIAKYIVIWIYSNNNNYDHEETVQQWIFNLEIPRLILNSFSNLSRTKFGSFMKRATHTHTHTEG